MEKNTHPARGSTFVPKICCSRTKSLCAELAAAAGVRRRVAPCRLLLAPCSLPLAAGSLLPAAGSLLLAGSLPLAAGSLPLAAGSLLLAAGSLPALPSSYSPGEGSETISFADRLASWLAGWPAGWLGGRLGGWVAREVRNYFVRRAKLPVFANKNEHLPLRGLPPP